MTIFLVTVTVINVSTAVACFICTKIFKKDLSQLSSMFKEAQQHDSILLKEWKKIYGEN